MAGRRRVKASNDMTNDRDVRLAMQLIGLAGVAVFTVGLFVEQVLLR